MYKKYLSRKHEVFLSLEKVLLLIETDLNQWELLLSKMWRGESVPEWKLVPMCSGFYFSEIKKWMLQENQLYKT